MASETTFVHWRVVFSWGNARKRALTQNPLIGGFWSFGFLIYTLSCVKIKKKPPLYIFFVSLHVPDTDTTCILATKSFFWVTMKKKQKGVFWIINWYKKLIVTCNQGQPSEFLQCCAREKCRISGCHQHEDCNDIEYCDCDDGAPCPGGSVGVCYPGCRDQVQRWAKITFSYDWLFDFREAPVLWPKAVTVLARSTYAHRQAHQRLERSQ